MRSTRPEPTIPDLSVFAALFDDLTDEERGMPAMIDGTSGDVMTYGELVGRAQAFAGALADMGIRPGDVVGLHCPNVPAFAIAFHGILRAGATATTVNALSTAHEIEVQLRASGAVAHVTVSPLAAQSLEAAHAVGIADDRIVVLDGLDGHPSLASLLAAGHPAPDVAIDPASHVAVMPYSSGTTGIPKGVRLSHRNLVANVAQCRPILGVERGERVLAVLPFFHIYGMTVLLNLALRARATLVTMPRFDLAEFLRVIQDHRVAFAFIAPPIAVALAKHPMVDEYDLSSLRTAFSGAAPLDEQLGHAVAERIDIEMLQGYGMTELSPVSHAFARGEGDARPLGSVGPVIGGTEDRIVDIESDESIEPPEHDGLSEPGELWVRGPQVMLGYLDDPESTAHTLRDDGFLRTGDLACYDAAGNVHIVDRLKELIKHHGYQVAPAELEALLLSHPDVADAAVVGVRTEDGDEDPKAFVVPAAGASQDADALMAWVAERVAPYKKVRQVAYVEAIPKSASGKILRKDLRDLA
ncbi:AMP-binding protein [Agrococcus sp. SGAir0287]|uniref:AMP-binding protein n=1 Tax=Agrococcus sp. SGAir0287 TaxID=2070347 RepID=UPI0010CCD5A8|nr:AMP-binding protein [Agrococcus sp. SGAir0287]QCR18342.1 4-coumarate--CoA ligase family protein [Agrococcus sp. SGAir0287]